METGMLKELDEHLTDLKKSLTAELAGLVAREIRKIAAELRASGPDAVSRKDACFRLGIGATKLKGMIARGEVLTCMGDPSRIPMSEIRRLTQPALPPAIRHGGGRKKKKSAYDPLADFEALGRRGRKT